MQLKNGLNVLLIESHKSPVVSVQMWVRTGSADEAPSEAGLSHFIEHLVFKGSKNYKVGEIAKVVEGSGGEINAYTSFDQTVFYVTISKQYTETGLDIISQMMGYPIFDADEINNEREVVIEEIKKGMDSAGRVASQQMFSQVYKEHTYGRPVIGYEKIIKNISVKKIKEYYKNRYVPENMFLIVSGDINEKTIKADIKKHFEGIPNHKLKKVKRPKEPVQKSPRTLVKKTQFPENLSYITWPIPDVHHNDTAALDILSLILGGGENSRLVQKLRIEKPTVKSISASTFTPLDNGIFTVVYDTATENHREVITTIFTEIEKIKNTPVLVDEIKRAVTLIQSDQFYSLETVDGLTRQVGHYYFYMKDETYFKKYLDKIYKLKPEDLIKVARKYLDPKRISFSSITKDDPKEIKKIFTSELKKSQTKKKASVVKKTKPIKHKKITWDLKSIDKKSPTTEKIVLPNGITLLLRPYKDTPVVSVRTAFLGGIRMEPNDKGGLCELLSRIWTSGTKTRSELEISTLTEDMASSLSAYSGRNTLGLSMEFLKPFEKESIDLFFDVLTHPTWPKDILEREKVILLQQIKARMQHPAQLAIKKLNENIFGDHPYGKDIVGTEESVTEITREDIVKYWSEVALRKNLTIIVTGDLDRKLWVDRISQISKEFKEGKKLNQTFDVKKLNKDESDFIHFDREQSHVVIAYKGLTLSDRDRYTMHVMEAVLSGQGGRLFIELRDKKSLAYSVSPMRMEGIEDGYFGGYIACSPEKVETAIDMLKSEFNRLIKEPVGSEELERAKKYLIGSHDIDLQKARNLGTSILYDDVYGGDYNETFKANEKYNAVTTQDIQILAKKIFSKPNVTVVVGKKQ